MVNQDNLIAKLGTHRTMHISALYYGLASIKADLQNIDLRGVVRRTIQGGPFRTDNGNIIIAVALSADVILKR